ncbi:hypothetical protein HaLaN_19350, partial [Haematococcus lacustris]
MPDLGLVMATITSSKGVAIWKCDEATTTIKTKKSRKCTGMVMSVKASTSVSRRHTPYQTPPTMSSTQLPTMQAWQLHAGLAVIHTQCVTASWTTDDTYSGGSPESATC